MVATRTINGTLHNAQTSAKGAMRTMAREATREPSAREHSEGKVAHMIENQTAKLPSDVFLWAALGSMAWSAVQYGRGNVEQCMFVGQWAPSFLLLGLYNKLVKQQGSDRVRSSAH